MLKGETAMFGKNSQKRNSIASPVPDSGSIIQANQVVKTYATGKETVHALKGIDFTVQRGDMVAIMGPSGCGKTTLLNCLSGLDTINSGQIWLEGKDLARMNDRERTTYRAMRMGFIFQVYNLLPVLSAVENVELPLLVTGVNVADARKRARLALARVGLEQWANHRPAEMSGGQRQRVTIARSLVTNPAVVWADEPTGALDSQSAADIMGLLIELNHQDDLTCIIVTHDPAIGQQCDRIVRMRDGQIVAPLLHPQPDLAQPHSAAGTRVTQRIAVGTLMF
jgi:putative ABC transport system ATP-binding protein